MPFVFEQPNLDNESESHLYFDPGDGRLITIFTNEERKGDPTRTPTDPGCVHHIAFAVSNATFRQAVERLDERGIEHSGARTAASWTRSTSTIRSGCGSSWPATASSRRPASRTPTCCSRPTSSRVERGDHNIDPIHLADAIEILRGALARVALGRRPLAQGSPIRAG